jgi:hypothetical protein
MRIADILYWHDKISNRNCAEPQLDPNLPPYCADLTKFTKAFTAHGVVKHLKNRTGKRTFLSKSRFMYGRQCSKKLWQTVYDPEPAEVPMPGTTKGMGIEVGIKARLLWPDGVLV